MNAIEAISQRINDLKNNVSKITEEEKALIQEKINIIANCEEALKQEDTILNYDFTNAMKLLEAKNINIDNIHKIINDVQSVLQIRIELNLSSQDMPLEEEQINVINNFIKELNIVQEELKEELNKISSSKANEKRIEILEELKKILEQTGKRKYYTEEMIETFIDEFDIANLPPQEAKELLMDFYETKNLQGRQKAQKADINEVIELYKQYLSPEAMEYFTELLKKHEKYVVSSINIENTREILEFFKSERIIEKFQLPSLLKVTLYGRFEYIKEVVYPQIMKNNQNDIEAFYQDDFATVWVKENGSENHRYKPFRVSRGESDGTNEEDIYTQCHKVSFEELEKNIEILKQNASLFDYKIIPDDMESNIRLKTLPTWQLKKNIELCKLFGLGTISPVPSTAITIGDIENKIHLAIELGLLNPPLTPAFLAMEKDIVKNDEFKKNYKKKKIDNHSIRNYYQRYLSTLPGRSINEFAYLFFMLQREGYTDFYNYFFSDTLAGKGNKEVIPQVAREILRNPKKMNEFVDKNFTITWYPELISNYDLYDQTISEYIEMEKEEEYSKNDYIDNSILNDPLIQDLDKNNMVEDIITHGDQVVARKNQYVYMFGNRIISRYKVLHNASILKSIYGSLNKEILMTSIVRNSFLDEESFNTIYRDVMGRGMVKC